MITQAIRRHQILINGHPAVKGVKPRPGDKIDLLALKEQSDNRVQPNPSIKIDLLYEDELLLAVNKPAGIPVQPLDSEDRRTLMSGLVARYPELASVGDLPLMAGALHRIDTETSGLVLAARTEAAFEAMREQFARRTIRKIYWALVEGVVQQEGDLVHNLVHHPQMKSCKMVDARDFPPGSCGRIFLAETLYRPIRTFRDTTLLEVTIYSGVTHQIRAQLSLAGFPIVNDLLYGARPRPPLTRHLLHACSATFNHPGKGCSCTLKAPLCPDFQSYLERLV